MKRHLTDVVQTTVKIIRSGASGQLHPGDTIGVWTFNESLYTGSLALQTWAIEDGEEIALRTGEFLRQQHYEKGSRLGLVLSGMFEVVKNSDIITIFLISDGSGKMLGTPFDESINALYQQSLQEMKNNPRPIVTVLQAKSGRVIKYTVTALPWPVVVPEVPIPLKTPTNIAARPAPAAAAQTATPSTATNVAANTPPPVEQPPRPPPTNAPAQTGAVAPAATAAAQPPPRQPASTPAVSVPPSTSAPVTAQSSPATVAVTTPKSAEPPQTKSAEVPKMPSTLPAVPAQSGPPPALTAAANPPRATNVPPSGTAPSPMPKPAAMPQTPTAAAANAKATSTPAAGNATNSLVAQATALFKSTVQNRRKAIIVCSTVLLVMVLGLILARIRRARRRSRISLITQSLDDRRR